MAAYVFYSWQSDLPNAVGRSFVERCLEAAIKRLNADTAIEPAARPLEVRSGTKGKAGINVVADTILERIDGAAVVVADLSYVATRINGTRSPNPNVLLEYGYALKSRTGGRIIAVMNTAYGDPAEEPLPFDLGHRDFPIRFHCTDGADADQRAKARETLTQQLVGELKLILGDASLPPVAPSEPHPHDVRLLETVYATFPLAFRHFLVTHDFGVQFRAKLLNPLHEAAEWQGASFEFHNPDLQALFANVRQHADQLTDLTGVHVQTYGENPMAATVKTLIDRERGTQPSTRKAIRALNATAAALADALDALELAARAGIRVSPLDVPPSRWPS